jgi:hypothetical protein
MTVPSMKDFILGSEEFLIRFYDLLEKQLETCTHVDEGGTPPQGRGLSRNPDTSLNMSGNSSVTGSLETHSSQDRMEEELDEDRETARRNLWMCPSGSTSFIKRSPTTKMMILHADRIKMNTMSFRGNYAWRLKYWRQQNK